MSFATLLQGDCGCAIDWMYVLDVAQKLVVVGGGAVGGGWVLYNYRRSRTHKSRLQLRVSAERVMRERREYLLIKTELSNVGLARVNLVNKGCALRVFAGQVPTRVESAMEPKWRRLETFDVFLDQHWEEPSGLLVDHQVVALPNVSGEFLKVWAHVESADVAWNANVVIAPLEVPAVSPAGKGVRT